MSKPSTAQKNPEAAEKTASETRATSTTSRKKEEKPGKSFNLFLYHIFPHCSTSYKRCPLKQNHFFE